MPTNRAEYYRQWYEKNKDKIAAYEKERATRRKEDPKWKEAHNISCKKYIDKIWTENPELALYNRAKYRATRKKIEFNISVSDIIIPKYCPYLGTELIAGINNPAENTPSLDRIDSTKGYTKDNIRVISAKSNIVKNNLTIEELKVFCKNAIELHEDPKSIPINDIKSILQ